MRKPIEERKQMLQTLKYIFSTINFAGKIATFEDHRKLMAHMSDLFNENISFEFKTESNL